MIAPIIAAKRCRDVHIAGSSPPLFEGFSQRVAGTHRAFLAGMSGGQFSGGRRGHRESVRRAPLEDAFPESAVIALFDTAKDVSSAAPVVTAPVRPLFVDGAHASPANDNAIAVVLARRESWLTRIVRALARWFARSA